MSLVVIATIAALLTATVSGIIGMAGGAMLLAILLWLDLPPNLVIPLHAAVQLVSNLTRVYAHLAYVRWRVFGIVFVSALPWPILGLWLASLLEPTSTRALIGLVVLYAAWAPKRGIQSIPETPAFALAGVLGGTLGVVIGAVGPIMAPFFLREGYDRRTIVATKAVCQAYLHILKIIAFTSIGFSIIEQSDLFLPMAAAVVAGTFIGKALLEKLTEESFRVVYKVILSLLGIRLIADAVI